MTIDEFSQGILRGAAINLITWIDYNAAEGNPCLSNIECKDIEDALVSGDWNKIYAYMKKKLERQDEQKPILDFKAADWYVSKVDGKIHNIYNSGVEPKFHKFHEGDWVVYKNDICQIVKREEGCNKLVTVFGIEKELVNERNLSTARLWTIADAKDGDILASDNSIFIFQEEYIAEKPIAYCGLMNGLFIKGNGACWTNEKCYPATKEQRELLFQKMHEAGYEWDAEKKEVKRIEKQASKPKWTEEDDYNVQCCIAKAEKDIRNGYSGRNQELIEWLKSLKQRMGGEE